jgi:hypothetical protein
MKDRRCLELAGIEINEASQSMLIKALTNDLGWSVGQQFENTATGDSYDDQNMNALKLISKWLHEHEDELDAHTEHYLEELDGYLKS